MVYGTDSQFLFRSNDPITSREAAASVDTSGLEGDGA